jgi:hypothetical protein
MQNAPDLIPADFARSLAKTASGKEVLAFLLHYLRGAGGTLSPFAHQAVLVLLLRSRREPSVVIDAIKEALREP